MISNVISEAGRARMTKRWLAIHEASALLGVSPATLRRWADAGEIAAFATPGGHRRFSRSAVLRLLPAGRGTDDAVVTGRSGATHGGDEHEWFRERGARLATALRGLVGATTPAERGSFAEAAEAAAIEFGRMAGCQGVGMADTLELFLGFRLPLLRDLMPARQRRRPGAADVIDPLETATEAIDHLLGAVVRGHQSAVAEPSPGSSMRRMRRGPTTEEVIEP